MTPLLILYHVKFLVHAGKPLAMGQLHGQDEYQEGDYQQDYQQEYDHCGQVPSTQAGQLALLRHDTPAGTRPQSEKLPVFRLTGENPPAISAASAWWERDAACWMAGIGVFERSHGGPAIRGLEY